MGRWTQYDEVSPALNCWVLRSGLTDAGQLPLAAGHAAGRLRRRHR